MIRISLVTLLVIVGISGCERSIINRGYDVGTADFDTITVGKDTPVSVAKKIGSPTFRSSVLHSNGDYCWHYSSKQMSKFGILNPQTVRTITYIITFGANDIVKSVERLEFEKPVPIERDTVNSNTGKTKGVFKETFGGMGKYIDMYDKK